MLTPAYNGCSCSCHHSEGVYHVAACCYPDRKPQKFDGPDYHDDLESWKIRNKICDKHTFKYVDDDMEMRAANGRSLILSFWPKWIWNRKDAVHLYGLNTPQYKAGAYNVSVDMAYKKTGEYRPFTLGELIGEKS